VKSTHIGLRLDPADTTWENIMLQHLQRLVARKDEKGASAVEYGLLVAAIAALIVVIVFALGGIVQDVFQSTCQEIKTEASTVSTTESCS
jgi:pilus assembly protein Flp/PilA